MFNILFPIDGKYTRFLQEHGYKLDPTHVYWYKKLSDDIEIEIQNCDNDLYKKGQIILHCQRACIIDDLTELQYIILNSVYENERLNRIIDEYEVEIVEKDKEIERLNNIKKEVREKIESVQLFGLRSGKTFIATLLNDILEILDKGEDND